MLYAFHLFHKYIKSGNNQPIIIFYKKVNKYTVILHPNKIYSDVNTPDQVKTLQKKLFSIIYFIFCITINYVNFFASLI